MRIPRKAIYFRTDLIQEFDSSQNTREFPLNSQIWADGDSRGPETVIQESTGKITQAGSEFNPQPGGGKTRRISGVIRETKQRRAVVGGVRGGVLSDFSVIRSILLPVDRSSYE